MKDYKRFALAATASIGVLAGTFAIAQDNKMTISYASSQPENSALNAGLIWWADEVARQTDGAVKVTAYHSGSLVGALELMPAAADGRVEMSYFAAVINPDRWPLWHFQGVPFQTEDPGAAMWAWYDLYQTNDLYRQEWERNNVHNLMQLSLPPAILGLSQPIESVEGLRDKRLRMVGLGAAALQALGIETVAGSPVELYTSIQRGVFDGYGAFPFDIVHTQGLHEVAPYMYDLGIGHYAAASIGVNLDWWNSLNPELQKIMTEASETFMREHAVNTTVNAEAAGCEKMLEGGAKITIFDEATRAGIRATIGESSIDTWRNEALAAGYTEDQLDDFLKSYMALYEKHLASSTYENGARLCAERAASR
jgi:TRAP-type C4-dicarboxylate transport system substrate-binding protein